MPVVVHRVLPVTAATPSDDGHQYVDGVLTLPTLPSTITVSLGGDVYVYPGEYVLFTYDSLVGDVGSIVLDTSDLTSAYVSGVASILHQAGQKRILVLVNGAATNGTQYVEGTLTISGPTQITLDDVLYGGPGTYTLFSYGSLSGSITDLVIIPPTGRSVDKTVSPNGCAISGSTITLTLV